MTKKDISYTVSARGKNEKMPVVDFLKENYSSIQISQIDSVFGFVEPSTLYSGRPFLKRQISDADTAVLNENNIGVRIPFSNHYITEEEYKNHISFFEKYQRKGNSVICTNDQLAKWIKRDFPGFLLEASVLKEIDTHEKIEKALELYDSVILPMNLNNNTEFLSFIKNKDRITLFGNAGCALTCPNRICYEVISKTNKKLATQNSLKKYITFLFHLGLPIDWCSYRLNPRRLRGLIDFDLDQLYDLGFRRFKILHKHTKRKSAY